MRVDRDELLARIDLAALADELLGGHKGHGLAARWPSPDPAHSQTGRTPPMSIFRDRRGIQRWHCFATGLGGTAIDLVGVTRSWTVKEAIEWLADRAHLQPDRHPPAPLRRSPQASVDIRGPSVGDDRLYRGVRPAAVGTDRRPDPGLADRGAGPGS